MLPSSKLFEHCFTLAWHCKILSQPNPAVTNLSVMSKTTRSAFCWVNPWLTRRVSRYLEIGFRLSNFDIFLLGRNSRSEFSEELLVRLLLSWRSCFYRNTNHIIEVFQIFFTFSIFSLYWFSFSLTLGSVLKNSIVEFTSRERETPSGKLSLWGKHCWSVCSCKLYYLSSPRVHPSSLASNSLSWLCCMLIKNISSKSE